MSTVEHVDWIEGVRPACPVCGHPTTGLYEVQLSGGRARWGSTPAIAVRARPCRDEVTAYAAVLQQEAILLEHQLAEQTAGLARADPDAGRGEPAGTCPAPS